MRKNTFILKKLAATSSVKGVVGGIIIMNAAIIWGIITASDTTTAGPNIGAGLLFMLGAATTILSAILMIIEAFFGKEE